FCLLSFLSSILFVVYPFCLLSFLSIILLSLLSFCPSIPRIEQYIAMGDVKSLVDFIHEITLDDHRPISPVPPIHHHFVTDDHHHHHLAAALLSPVKTDPPHFPLSTPNGPDPPAAFDDHYFSDVLPHMYANRKRLSTIAEETEIASSILSRRESRPHTNPHLRVSEPALAQVQTGTSVREKHFPREPADTSGEMQFLELTVPDDAPRHRRSNKKTNHPPAGHSPTRPITSRTPSPTNSVLGSIMEQPLLIPSPTSAHDPLSDVSARHSDRSILGALLDQIAETPSQTAARFAREGMPFTTPFGIPNPARFDDDYTVTPMRNPYKSRKALFGRAEDPVEDDSPWGPEGVGLPSPGRYFAARSGPLGDLEGLATPSRRPHFSNLVQLSQPRRTDTPSARHRQHILSAETPIRRAPHNRARADPFFPPADSNNGVPSASGRFFGARNAPLDERVSGNNEAVKPSPPSSPSRPHTSPPPLSAGLPSSSGTYFATHNAALDEIFGTTLTAAPSAVQRTSPSHIGTSPGGYTGIVQSTPVRAGERVGLDIPNPLTYANFSNCSTLRQNAFFESPPQGFGGFEGFNVEERDQVRRRPHRARKTEPVPDVGTRRDVTNDGAGFGYVVSGVAFREMSWIWEMKTERACFLIVLTGPCSPHAQQPAFQKSSTRPTGQTQSATFHDPTIPGRPSRHLATTTDPPPTSRDRHRPPRTSRQHDHRLPSIPSDDYEPLFNAITITPETLTLFCHARPRTHAHMGSPPHHSAQGHLSIRNTDPVYHVAFEVTGPHGSALDVRPSTGSHGVEE
ncbi:hypothetical protein BC938DRAFT_470545, partial [Jimgerdemannia flammicorona]